MRPHRVALLLIGIACAVAQRNAWSETPPSFLGTWGSFGAGPGQFNRPWSVAIDAAGYVFVTDFYNNRVQKFLMDGTYVGQWGGFGTGDGQFHHPVGIAVDHDGNVYVAEHQNHRVSKFTNNGVFIKSWGRPAGPPESLGYPVELAIGADNVLYVTNVYTAAIQKYTLDGAYLGGWTVAGTALIDPYGVAVGPNGMVYVASNSQLLIYDTSGVLQGTIGSIGPGPGQFFHPHGIATDAAGNLLVADTENHRVQKLSPSGSHLWSIGSPGAGPGQFNLPVDVTIDAGGRIYVTDHLNHRIQVFSFGVTPTQLASWGRVKAAYR